MISYAAIRIVDGLGRTLLLLRSKDAKINPNQWAFPGGKIEHAETPEQAVRRELKEETGLEVGVIWKLPSATLSDGSELNLFATRLRVVGPITLNPEHSDYHWAPTGEMPPDNTAPVAKRILEACVDLTEFSKNA